MAMQTVEIIPAEFPELTKLAWNRDPRRPMADDEVFALYERNWRFVDHEHLTEEETRLLRELCDKYGHGLRLV
ncbi:hypothetical protein MesoLjLc_03350 [Mesorhizobium sp. L-8-10]|nr:hypothetical protein MesoLjLb_03410 [Mesorhizobium sp. L-8-3]BCH28405.1 hypothetical protein MesoLjLc_03350 [Mesorhizobium sp. L-8-10]